MFMNVSIVDCRRPCVGAREVRVPERQALGSIQSADKWAPIKGQKLQSGQDRQEEEEEGQGRANNTICLLPKILMAKQIIVMTVCVICIERARVCVDDIYFVNDKVVYPRPLCRYRPKISISLRT